MEKDNTSKIDWINIILNEDFKSYLNLDSLKELSLVSKLVRFRLGPRVFRSIKLRAMINNTDEYFVVYNNIIGSYELSACINSDGSALCRNLYTPEILNQIQTKLTSINEFVSIFNFECIDRSGYILFPILQNFNNLKRLKLYDCGIPYSGIVNLGELFPKLEDVELDKVLLVKLVTDSYASKDFIFPSNLKNLYISNANFIERDDLFDLWESPLEDIYDFTSYRFKLPKISIPSLKKLSYKDSYENSNDIEQFLSINPNLESLSLKYFYFSKVYNFKSLKDLETDYLNSYINEPNLSANETIKQFTTTCGVELYEKIELLMKSMPNIEKLHLRILSSTTYFKQLFDFLTPLLSNSPKVKSLYLDIRVSSNDTVNISKFYHIESIVFEFNDTDILNIKFEDCINLKFIEFKLEAFDNTKFMREYRKLCDNAKNWKFSYSKMSIKGYKITQ